MVFQFKKFQLLQDKSAMKVGTDSVLLGAWASLDHHPKTILDVGAGTGILALQLAQRSTAECIDGVELNDDAFEECVTNFENSPWSDRLFCYHASFQELVEEMDEKYDSILSNPPYFVPPITHFESSARTQARYTETLSFQELLEGVAQLLAEEGVFSCVLPFQQYAVVMDMAQQVGLHLVRICYVQGTAHAEVKRCLLEFCWQPKPLQEETLVIEIARHTYTPAYIALTKDFYLHM